MSEQNNKKTIGILGGMGPLASANLYYQIIEAAQNLYQAEQDTDFPPMFIYNLPLVGFDETGSLDPFVKDQLVEGVKKLEEAGSDLVIIACNTVHYFYEDMQNAINIPILNIIEETVKAVHKKNCKKVGLLTSASTNESGLYQKELKKFGIRSLSVNETQQKILDQIILDVMAGSQGEPDQENIKNISHELIKQGAEGIVLGCTELPLAVESGGLEVETFPTTDIIARSALGWSMPKKVT